jgi:RND family efflux transporter MFP subunit
MKRMKFRSLSVFALYVSLLACSEVPAPVAARVLPVEAIEPRQSDQFELKRQAVGRVVAAQRVDSGFELSGKIARVFVNQGEAVSAGQPLAELDKRMLQVASQELQAQQRETRARLKLVRSSLKRQQSLQKQGFSAEQQLDELEAEEQALLAGLERLEASLAANQLQIEKSVLVAPYAGVVSQRYADVGAVVTAGVPVIQLLESSELEVVVGIPVNMAADLKLGAKYPVVVGKDTFDATLIAVGSDLNAITRTVKLRLALPVDNLRDGELAMLMLPQKIAESGFWLPSSALADGVRGLWNCYVLEPVGAGQYRVQAVNVGVLHVEEDRVYVSGALADKLVIATGLHRVVPGQLVVTSKSAEG